MVFEKIMLRITSIPLVDGIAMRELLCKVLLKSKFIGEHIINNVMIRIHIIKLERSLGFIYYQSNTKSI